MSNDEKVTNGREWVSVEEQLEYEVKILKLALEECCRYLGAELIVPVWIPSNDKAYMHFFTSMAMLREKMETDATSAKTAQTERKSSSHALSSDDE